MTIHEALLKKARAAGTRLADAERQVQLARNEYHAIVRRMHLAGGSLREIAQALDLSHQRVQQMVDGAGGSWWQRVWRARNVKNDLTCTFCNRPQSQVARLIAGPKVYICDACIAAAEESMTGSSPYGSLALAGEGARARCSFCGKGRTSDRLLLTGPRGNVCGECLNVCRQILIDSAA
ncbi:MAG: hypothetical protein LAP85_21530 [Acidobacteriia bacterium]|nr:hypothetical protein [Terriglobia bacterium]